MFPPILAYRNLVGATQGVVTFGGGTPKQLGNDVIGSLETAGTNNTSFSHNRVVWFKGCLYVATTIGVYCLNAGTGVWDSVHSYINVTNHYDISSLQVWSGQDGSQRLWLMRKGSFNSMYVVSSEDGVVWNTSTSPNYDSTIAYFVANGASWDDYYYFRVPYVSAVGVAAVNHWSGLISPIDQREFGGPSTNINYWANNIKHGCFIASNESFYYIDKIVNTTNSTLYIYEFNGSTWEEVFAIPTATYRAGATATSSRNQVCFPDPVTDGIFYYLNNGRHSGDTLAGVVCLKVDLTGTDITVTDIGDDILSPSIRVRAGYAWFSVFVDDITDPINPVVYFGFLPDAIVGNNWTYYRFVSDTIEAVQEASIPYGYALPYGNLSDGFRINQLDSNYADVGSAELVEERIIAPDGSLQFGFEVHGGQTALSGRLYWGLKGEIPTNPATLTGTPSGGSISRSGNNLLGINGDGTVYTAFWDFSANGFFEIDNVNLKLVVE